MPCLACRADPSVICPSFQSKLLACTAPTVGFSPAAGLADAAAAGLADAAAAGLAYAAAASSAAASGSYAAF